MKTLKSIIIACLYIIICTDVTAKDLTGVRIYINPGHGGFDHDQRPKRSNHPLCRQ